MRDSIRFYYCGKVLSGSTKCLIDTEMDFGFTSSGLYAARRIVLVGPTLCVLPLLHSN